MEIDEKEYETKRKEHTLEWIIKIETPIAKYSRSKTNRAWAEWIGFTYTFLRKRKIVKQIMTVEDFEEAQVFETLDDAHFFIKNNREIIGLKNAKFTIFGIDKETKYTIEEITIY